VQGVRAAVNRTVARNELENLRLFLDTASGPTGQLPTPAEVSQSLQKEAPQTWRMVQDGKVLLTGIRNREGIWAYTADPQTPGGDHLVVTNSGIEQMNGAVMRQRLQQQGAP
jgi:hypothetical protein